MVILDSDHISLLQRGTPESVRIEKRLDKLQPEEIAATIVSFEEQTRGWLAFAARSRSLDESVHAYGLLKVTFGITAISRSCLSIRMRQAPLAAFNDCG